jgi:hypothetical protein
LSRTASPFWATIGYVIWSRRLPNTMYGLWGRKNIPPFPIAVGRVIVPGVQCQLHWLPQLSLPSWSGQSAERTLKIEVFPQPDGLKILHLFPTSATPLSTHFGVQEQQRSILSVVKAESRIEWRWYQKWLFDQKENERSHCRRIRHFHPNICHW